MRLFQHRYKQNGEVLPILLQSVTKSCSIGPEFLSLSLAKIWATLQEYSDAPHLQMLETVRPIRHRCAPSLQCPVLLSLNILVRVFLLSCLFQSVILIFLFYRLLGLKCIKQCSCCALSCSKCLAIKPTSYIHLQLIFLS